MTAAAPPAFDRDLHVHTIYSGHSGPEMFIPAVMARAADAGLREVLILEHVPALTPETCLDLGKWARGRNDRSALAAILAETAPRRATYPATRFLAGVEVDADPVRMDGSLMLRDFSGTDVVLAATHLVPGGLGFWFDRPDFPEDERPALARNWIAWIEKVVRRPEVDVLAHPVCEMAACRLAGSFGPSFRRSFARVLQAMADCGTAFELNEAAIGRFSPEEAAGYVELIREARDCGVLFSVGSDAHHGDQMGGFNLVRETAAAAGLTEDDMWKPR